MDVRAKTITDEMCIAASYALANSVYEIKGCFLEDCILPTMEFEEMYIKVAIAVGLKAIEQGIAKIKLSEDELYNQAKNIIHNTHSQVKVLMESGLILPYKDYVK